MENTFLKLAEERYSVRKFTDEKVSDEITGKILRAAQVAPTACNNQPQLVYVIKSEEALGKLQKCKHSHYNEQLAFIVCYDKTKCWKREFDGALSGDIDCSIVATHMMLEAWENGIGSTWIMYFVPDAVREEFGLPENIIPSAILVMGHIPGDSQPNPRHKMTKSIEELTECL